MKRDRGSTFRRKLNLKAEPDQDKPLNCSTCASCRLRILAIILCSLQPLQYDFRPIDNQKSKASSLWRYQINAGTCICQTSTLCASHAPRTQYSWQCRSVRPLRSEQSPLIQLASTEEMGFKGLHFAFALEIGYRWSKRDDLMSSTTKPVFQATAEPRWPSLIVWPFFTLRAHVFMKYSRLPAHMARTGWSIFFILSHNRQHKVQSVHLGSTEGCCAVLWPCIKPFIK